MIAHSHDLPAYFNHNQKTGYFVISLPDGKKFDLTLEQATTISLVIENVIKLAVKKEMA